VHTGFNNFDEYLKHNNKTIKSMSSFKNKRLSTDECSSKVEEMRESEFEREGTHNDSKYKSDENELIIRQCEVPHANYYSFKSKGGTLGRNENNQIAISD
jgi:hypothetical protein